MRLIISQRDKFTIGNSEFDEDMIVHPIKFWLEKLYIRGIIRC